MDDFLYARGRAALAAASGRMAADASAASALVVVSDDSDFLPLLREAKARLSSPFLRGFVPPRSCCVPPPPPEFAHGGFSSSLSRPEGRRRACGRWR